MSGYKSSLGIGASVTLVDGAFAVDAFRDSYTLDTQAAAASDDLDTINGGKSGKTITIQTTSSARDIVVKNGTGNITLDADITLGETTEHLTLRFNGSGWNLIAGGSSTVVAPVTSAGAAADIQLADGSGGFDSEDSGGFAFDKASDTLLMPANSTIHSASAGGSVTVRSNASATSSKVITYGQEDVGGVALKLDGGTGPLDTQALNLTITAPHSDPDSTANATGGTLILQGANPANTGTVTGGGIQIVGGPGGFSAGDGTGGDVEILGGTSNGAGTEGNVVLAESRGNVGIGVGTPAFPLEVSGAVNLSKSPAKDTDPATVHIADYLDIVSKDIVLAIGGGAVASVNLGWDVPAGAIVLGATMNVETVISDGGGGAATAAVSLGIAADIAKYCETTGIAADSKSAQTPRDLTTVALEDLVVYATDGSGGQTTEVMQNGSVRVRLVYIDIDTLPNV